MAEYHGALETAKGQPDVFDYIIDFRNAADWDPATGRARRTCSGA